MNDSQQQLYGLMVLAEEQQKAVQAALDGLTAERAALAKERVTFAGTVRRAVDESITQSFDGFSSAAANAIDSAVKPAINGLSDVMRAAIEAEGQLKNASQWFAWKWVAVLGAGIAMVSLFAWASVWWQREQVGQLIQQRDALEVSVAELQANIAALDAKGGRIKLSKCGPSARLCVEASRNQGAGETNWKAPWADNTTGQQYVIPKGY